MTIPIMVMNVMTTLFNTIDMIVLRVYSNDNAVGAVGACGMLITLCTSLLIGASVGANVIVANRIGAGDRKRTECAVTTSLIISIVGSFVLLVIGAVFSETFLRWINCPVELLPQAAKYLKIYFYSLPFYMFYTFCASILRAMGDAKRPMHFMLLGGVIKVAFTVLFVACFNLGVEGVAYASIIAHLVESSLSFFVLYRSKEYFCINLKKIKFDVEAFKGIFHIGITAGISSSIFAFMNLLISSTVNSFGKDATTGIAIASQFDAILYQICHSPALAVTPYISQNVGANNIKRVKQTVVRGVMIAGAVGVGFGAVLMALSKPLVMAMSSSEAVIAFALQKLIITSPTYCICGIQDLFAGVLRGLGKPNIPTFVVLMCVCPLRLIWVLVLFPMVSNITFLYAVCSAEWVLTSITMLIIYLVTVARVQARETQPSVVIDIL